MLKKSVAFLLVVMSAFAFSQEAPPAKQLVLGKQIFYAIAKDIREELKVTEAQMKKIIEAFQGSLSVDGDRIMVMMDPSLDMDECEKKAIKALDEGQQKRLEEIWIQELGAIAAVDEKIGKALKLDDSQKKTINQLIEDTAKAMMELFMESHDADTAKKAKGLRMKASEKAKGLFTEEQLKAFEAMKGKAFKRKIDDIG